MLSHPAYVAAHLAIIALLACGSKQPAPAEPSRDKPPELDISFESFVLDNGLTVILHRDPSDPIVAMATVVHVGSNRERPGRTGFAHFFEHMSFNNSENVPMGANRKLIPELGGSRNGGTWSDGTIYYEVVPKDALEKLMWIDSDRFGYMINTVREGTLEREKQVVKNEKRQRVDNRPYGHTDHVIRKALYPPGHPYSWTVIGDLEDLQKATLADVREFYQRFYGPQNATLVVAGDIDIAETKSLVRKWFGEIPAGEAVADMQPMPVSLQSSKRLFHADSFARLPELRITFPTVEEFHPDSYALEALGAVLSDGKSTPLFRDIVREAKLSSDISAQQSSDELAGTFTIRVRANPGVDLDVVEATIRRSLTRFEKDGFRAEDLERFKANGDRLFYNELAGVLDRALKLGIYHEFAGDAGVLRSERERYRAVTQADVERVYKRYIANRPAIFTSFVPKGSESLALEGSERAAVDEEQIVAGAEKEFLEADPDDFRRTPTKHDRSEPPLGELPPVRAPEVWSTRLENGVDVRGVEHRELPLVNFLLRIDGGQLLDPPDKQGVARLAAELLNEGTKSKTPTELEDALELLGATIRVEADRTSIELSGQTLARNFEQTMALLTEMIIEPRWDQVEFDRLKRARLAEIEESLGEAPSIAANVFHRRLYGDDHVGGQRFGGTEKTVSSITLADVADWYTNTNGLGRAQLSIAGAISESRASAALTKLAERWQRNPRALPTPKAVPATETPRVYFVDMPGAKQSVIYVGKVGVAGDDDRFYPLTVINNRLGGGTSARLTQTLRIEKGYSYGAYSRFVRSPYPGPFIASGQVRSNVTRESLAIFRDLIADYRATFTAEDLATTKNLLKKSDTRRFETLADLVDMLDAMGRFNLPDDYIARQSKVLASMTLAQAHELISSHLALEDMTFVVVGDATTQLPKLEELGLGPAIVTDRHGSPIEN